MQKGILTLILMTSSIVSAQVLPLTLGDGEIHSIMTGEVLSRSSAAGEDVASLVPENSSLHSTLMNIPQDKKGFAVASVSFIPCNKSITELYNALMSVSTQKGITYISRREGMKPKVLFDKSYFIEGNYAKDCDITAASDPIVSVVPASATRWAYQEDSSFGGNIYRYDTASDGRCITAHITNETAMKYHGVTCLKEEELSMFVALTPVEGGVVVNTAAIITGHKSKVRVLVISVDLSSSFSRRTRALHDWYKSALE